MNDAIVAATFSIVEDLLYLFLLLGSVFIGFFVRIVDHAQTKQRLCTLLGIATICLLSGYYVVFPVAFVFINACIILFINRQVCDVISFIFSFGTLILLRIAMHFGWSISTEFTNTTLMILILKMVGLASEVKSWHSETNANENCLANLKFCDIVHYSFCYAGIMVGPYYKFQTYMDFLNSPYSKHIPYWHFLKKRISDFPVYLILYLVSDHLFPSTVASVEELHEQEFFYKFFLMTPWFFTFRMRMYVAFVLGECICINVGLGAYPEDSIPLPGAGPTNGTALEEIHKKNNLNDIKYSFECIRCMDEYASEFGHTMRDGIRYWNLTVQYWLAVYIYQRANTSKPVKIILTMFTSAIWHGVRLGYYLSLLGTPLLLLAEAEVRKAFRKLFEKRWFRFVWYIVKMQCLAYMGVAFMLPNAEDTLRYWNSIYFTIHIFLIIIYTVAFFVNRFNKLAAHSTKKEIKTS